MKLKDLANEGACSQALDWFLEHFKQEAPTAEVLKAAYDDRQHGWIEWYFESFPSERNMPDDFFDQLRKKSDQDRLTYLREFYPAPKAKKKLAKKKPVKAVKAVAKKKKKIA